MFVAFKIYLYFETERVIESGKKRSMERYLNIWFTPKWLQWLRLDQAVARNEGLHVDLPSGFRGPWTWAILPLL